MQQSANQILDRLANGFTTKLIPRQEPKPDPKKIAAEIENARHTRVFRQIKRSGARRWLFPLALPRVIGDETQH